MFRGLISLLLVAGFATTPIAAMPAADEFDMGELLNVNPFPVQAENANRPVVNAKSAVAIDLETGIILYEKNAFQRLPMASLTKIMTAVLILESHRLSEAVTVADDFSAFTEEDLGVRIWLRQYEKITVGDLLIALLVPSAGDAAITLAKYHSGSLEKFAAAMNAKAKILDMRDTNFTNPIGLDNPYHYSSAYDLATLTRYALRNGDFRRIVKMPTATIRSTDGRVEHTFAGTNYLLGSYLDIQGVKTGTTAAAGPSVINLAVSPDGREVVVVLLNSPDRFQEAKRLFDWAFRSFRW